MEHLSDPRFIKALALIALLLAVLLIAAVRTRRRRREEARPMRMVFRDPDRTQGD